MEISEVLSENDDEKAEKDVKTLDIMDVLWQNNIDNIDNEPKIYKVIIETNVKKNRYLELERY